MDQQSIESAIKKAQKGIDQYLEIMELFPEVDVSADSFFQRKFNAFYRIRQRPSTFYSTFYEFMQQQKGKDVDFPTTLQYLHSKLNSYEASFSSKLVATHNPHMPIWDQFVLKNTGMKSPPTYIADRMNKIVAVYNDVVKWYDDYIQRAEGKLIISLFNGKVVRSSEITDLKKIDFVLWQIRA